MTASASQPGVVMAPLISGLVRRSAMGRDRHALPLVPGVQPGPVVGLRDGQRPVPEEDAQRRVFGVDDREYGGAGGFRVASTSDSAGPGLVGLLAELVVRPERRRVPGRGT